MRKKTYKCPSNRCKIIKELRKYSNKNNTFISNNLDALQILELKRELEKRNIQNLVIIGGWFTYCVLSTTYNCINIHNILPIIIEDALFDGVSIRNFYLNLKIGYNNEKTKNISEFL